MPLRVYHAGGRLRRGVFRLVLVDVRGRHVGRATAAAAAAAAARPATEAAVGAGRRVVRARRSHAGRLPHARQPVKRRRLHPLDQTVQRLHRLQFGHHLVQQPVWSRPGQVQRHAFRLYEQHNNRRTLIAGTVPRGRRRRNNI